MEAAHSSPNVLVLAKDPEHLARLEEANKLLEEIQKVRVLQAHTRGCRAIQNPWTCWHTNKHTLHTGASHAPAQLWWCLTVRELRFCGCRALLPTWSSSASPSRASSSCQTTRCWRS